MDAHPSRETINWRTLLLGLALVVASAAGGVSLVLAHSQYRENLVEHIKYVPAEAMAVVHFSETTQKIADIIKETCCQDEVWLLENLHTLHPTIALLPDDTLVIVNKENWPETNAIQNRKVLQMNDVVIISEKDYKKPAASMAHSRDFRSTMEHINQSAETVFYINTQATVDSLPHLYFGWKKFFRQSLAGLAGSVETKGGELTLKAFLKLDANMFPNISPSKQQFLRGSLLSMEAASGDISILGKDIKSAATNFLEYLENTNLPLALECKKTLKNFQKNLYIEQLEPESLLALFDGEFAVRFNMPEKKFVLITTGNNIETQTLLATLREKSRYITPAKQYFTLPDKTTGAEQIAKNAAPIETTAQGEVKIDTIALKKGVSPAFATIEGATIIASSPEEIRKVLTEKKEETPKEYNRYRLTFNASGNPVVKEWLGEMEEVQGGIEIMNNGLLLEMSAR